jgi:cytoskeletal protein RodZ
MKKVMVLVLSIAVALAFASMVMAQSNPPAKAPHMMKDSTTTTTTTTTSKPAPSKAPATTTTTTTTTKTVAPKEKRIKGTVVSVDAVANTIVVKVKDAEKTFTLDPAAKIMVAGKPAQLADIQKDAKVTVVYKFDGKKRVALAIR